MSRSQIPGRRLALVAMVTTACTGRVVFYRQLSGPNEGDGGVASIPSTLAEASVMAPSPASDDAGSPAQDATTVSDDASPSLLDAGSWTADPLAAPCIDAGYAMVVNANGYAGLRGVYQITGASGTWSAGLSSSSRLEVTILAPARWGITATSDFVNGSYISAGMTYVPGQSDNLPVLLIAVDGGGGCPTLPQGTFTIDRLIDTGADQADVSALLLSFDLTCGDSGTAVGCVAYGN